MSPVRHRRCRPDIIHDPDPLTDAKKHAMDFARAVHGDDAATIRRITAGMGWEHLVALAIVGYEAIKPGELRLLQVVKARDEEDADAA